MIKTKTIDYMLRATWQAVSRMYNEEASKFDGSMAIGFALLSIDKELVLLQLVSTHLEKMMNLFGISD